MPHPGFLAAGNETCKPTRETAKQKSPALSGSVVGFIPPTTNFATFAKYSAISSYIQNMSVKDKRATYQVMRQNTHVDHNSLLTKWSLTCGEFATWQILAAVQDRVQ
jgi:hypothetical protein